MNDKPESLGASIFGVVGVLFVIGIVLLGSLSLLGRKVSQTFSNIDSGLDGGGYSAAAPPPRPVATPNHASSPPATPAAAAEPRRVQGAVAPIKAGELNDNDDYASYVNFVARFDPQQQALISERYLFHVLDGKQQPLRNAEIEVYADNQRIFQGRTYAGGTALVMPKLAGVNEQAGMLRYIVRYNQSQVEGQCKRTTCATCLERVEVGVSDATTNPQLALDLLFMLDTTGSMGDELANIQGTIQSIADRIDAFTPRPSLRFGLIAYRDHGDTYVTRSYDFTADVVAFQQILNDLSADAGGDKPEALNEALARAIDNLSWNSDAIRLTFLVADAGPHDTSYRTTLTTFVERGIKIYPIGASGTDDPAEYTFRELAQRTLGRFIFLTYQTGESSGAPGESTTLQAGEQPYTVDRLDDLVVLMVQRELGAAVGKQ